MPETTISALSSLEFDPDSSHDIHRVIMALGDVQAVLDSVKITLYKSLNASRQAESTQVIQYKLQDK